MPMNQTTQHLDDESGKALTLLARCRIQSLMSESCHVQAGSAVLEVLSVSIQIETKRFIVIESDWGDTPVEWLDFHSLSVRISGTPKDIHYNPKPPKDGGNYRFDHLSLSLGAEAPIVTIEVLEASVIGEKESVAYDAGLLITRQDGLKLAIVRAESILGSMQIAHTPADVQELTAGLTVRARYGA